MSPSAPPPASTTNPSTARYDWRRFWVRQTDVLDLSDAGFLRDPEDPFGGHGLPQLPELAQYRGLVLLGEPGIGKSSELKSEHDRLSALTAPDRALSVYADLKVYSSEDTLRRRIFETPQFSGWKAGSGCQSAPNLDPLSASNNDPFSGLSR